VIQMLLQDVTCESALCEASVEERGPRGRRGWRTRHFRAG
jgi:hypothetical protein